MKKLRKVSEILPNVEGSNIEKLDLDDVTKDGTNESDIISLIIKAKYQWIVIVKIILLLSSNEINNYINKDENRSNYSNINEAKNDIKVENRDNDLK